MSTTLSETRGGDTDPPQLHMSSRNLDLPSNAQLLLKLTTLIHHFQAINYIYSFLSCLLQQRHCLTCFSLTELYLRENRLDFFTHSFQILHSSLLQLISALFFFSHHSLDFPAVRGNKSTICLDRRYVSTRARPIGHMVSQSPRDVHVPLYNLSCPAL